MEENNYEEQINEILGKINEFNNGNDELVYEIEKVLDGVIKYAHNTTSNYIKFKLIELYLDLSLMIVNKKVRQSEEYQTIHQYYQDDLAFFLKAASSLKKYVKKCQKSGDVDDLDAAYLMTIYLSYILSNLSDYVEEIKKITGNLVGSFYYRPDAKLRERTNLDIEEIKKLMKMIEKEGE